MVRKVLTWGMLTFALFYIAYAPEKAVLPFKALGSGIMEIAQGLGEFFGRLVA